MYAETRARTAGQTMTTPFENVALLDAMRRAGAAAGAARARIEMDEAGARQAIGLG